MSDHRKSSLEWISSFVQGTVGKWKKNRDKQSWLHSFLRLLAEPIAISLQFVDSMGWSILMLQRFNWSDAWAAKLLWEQTADQWHHECGFGFWHIATLICLHSAWGLTPTDRDFKCHIVLCVCVCVRVCLGLKTGIAYCGCSSRRVIQLDVCHRTNEAAHTDVTVQQ